MKNVCVSEREREKRKNFILSARKGFPFFLSAREKVFLSLMLEKGFWMSSWEAEARAPLIS